MQYTDIHMVGNFKVIRIFDMDYLKYVLGKCVKAALHLVSNLTWITLEYFHLDIISKNT